MGPCFCGDYACSSCGPAQGYTRCRKHRKYACEECSICYYCGEHIEECEYDDQEDLEFEEEW